MDNAYLNALKINVINELFVRTADENYITARWCAFNELNVDFFWLAAHSIEKYLKAVLLVNGESALKGHNIVNLYADVKTKAGQLLPTLLSKPQHLNEVLWIEVSAEEFIRLLNLYGDPDNRYLTYGYVMQPQDLFKLDQMVFAIRRLIRPLQERVFPSELEGAPNITHEHYLINRPAYDSSLSMPLDNLIQATTENLPIRMAALNRNMAFAPTDFPHETTYMPVASARNPVIVRRILEPIERGDLANEELALAEWLLDNIKLPKTFKQKINAGINVAKRQQPGSRST